jgi:hypothetical protein
MYWTPFPDASIVSTNFDTSHLYFGEARILHTQGTAFGADSKPGSGAPGEI